MKLLRPHLRGSGQRPCLCLHQGHNTSSGAQRGQALATAHRRGSLDRQPGDRPVFAASLLYDPRGGLTPSLGFFPYGG